MPIYMRTFNAHLDVIPASGPTGPSGDILPMRRITATGPYG